MLSWVIDKSSFACVTGKEHDSMGFYETSSCKPDLTSDNYSAPGLQLRAVPVSTTARVHPCQTCRYAKPHRCTQKWTRTYFKKHLREGILFIATRFDVHDEHTRHPRDQPGQRRYTRQIVSTAGAAAWLPHSKLRHTRMISDQGNLFSA